MIISVSCDAGDSSEMQEDKNARSAEKSDFAKPINEPFGQCPQIK